MTVPRIFSSAKFQAALAATVIAAIPLIFTLTDKGIDRATKQAQTETFVRNLLIVWSVAIGATGLEDAAQKYNPVQQHSPVQVNTAENQNISPPQNAASITTPQTPPVVPFTQRGFNVPLDPTTKP